MNLVKYVVCTNGWEDVIYCANGAKIEDKKCKLLGFYLQRPVLGCVDNTMSNSVMNNITITNQTPSAASPSKSRVIKDNNTGDRFIFLNGKKLKILPPSQIPPNIVNTSLVKNVNQLLKANCGNINGVPSKSNIVSAVNKKTLVKVDIDKLNNVNIDKISRISEVTSSKESNLESVSSPQKVLNNITTLRGEDKKYIKLNREKMQALDLRKDNLVKLQVISSDKPASKLETAEKGVQTEHVLFFDDMDLMLTPHYFDELDINIPASPPQNLPVNSEMQKPMNIVPGAAKFFTELRSALQPDDKGNMPIHVGVLTNDLNMVKRSWLILKAMQQPIDLLNNAQLTPMQLAVMHHTKYEILSFLIEQGADINQVDDDGNHLLHLAVECENTDGLLTILRNRTVDLNVFNNEGLTPLMISCQNHLTRCADMLLECKADINLRDQISGRTALFHAAERHDVQMVKLLMSYSADTKIKNFFGISPHDAMYEIDDMPEEIKSAILGKIWKKRSGDDSIDGRTKKKQIRRIEMKTYARFQKVDTDVDVMKVS